MIRPRAVYVHVPFCRHRCGYCNFTVVAGRDDLIPRYLQSVQREMQAADGPNEVDTIFLGGGTPSHLPPHQLRVLLTAVTSHFPLAKGGEFSVEMNPEDATPSTIDVLAESGVTRVSLGVQSVDERKLVRLERSHRRQHVWDALANLRGKIGSIAIDLIFAVPGEDLATWLGDLNSAIELNPDHVSAYGLTFERGTRFGTMLQKSLVEAVDEEPQAAMYEAAIDVLCRGGFEHYEVSNFAKPGHRCRHNEVYWRGEEYFAVGPGAARYINGRREVNHRSTTSYLNRMSAGTSPVAESERLGPEDAARERLVFGLRMLEGVHVRDFADRTGYTIEQLVGDVLPELLDFGLLESTDSHLRLTRHGLLLSDSIWPKFLRA